MPATPALDQLVSRLPQPLHQLFGRPPAPLVLPSNIVCFQRTKASELNKPRRGRALHHRFVLIFALRTPVTACIDDREVRLHTGEGLLVFPFQFHHYIKPEREAISWLFVTFELAEAEPLAALRYRPFELTPRLRALAAELVEAYETQRTDDLPVLLLALLLARLRRLKGSANAAPAAPVPEQGLAACKSHFRDAKRNKEPYHAQVLRAGQLRELRALLAGSAVDALVVTSVG